MAETLSTLSIISFAASAVFLLLAIFFFFFFKIPTAIGDLSGKTARKSIAKMRAANEKTGVKVYKESKTNAERGKLTGTIPDLGKVNKNDPENNEKPETGLLKENKAVSIESVETGVLSEKNTALLDEEETVLLVNNQTATSKSPAPSIKRTDGKKLKMIEEIIFVHTDEVIE